MLVKEKGRWAVFQERGACFFGVRFACHSKWIACSQATTKDLIKLEIVLFALNPVQLTEHTFFPEKAAIFTRKKLECLIIQ